MVATATVRIANAHGVETLEADAWPRAIVVEEHLAASYRRDADLIDFRLANTRAIYRITNRGEDGVLSGELVYEEWYP